MKKLLIIWIIISFILIGGLTFIGINLNSKNREYYDLESKIKEAAQNYYAQYPYELPAKESEITSERLLNTNFLSNLNYKNETCEGYVVIKKTYLSHKYIPYIKCLNYNTKNYDGTRKGV